MTSLNKSDYIILVFIVYDINSGQNKSSEEYSKFPNCLPESKLEAVGISD